MNLQSLISASSRTVFGFNSPWRRGSSTPTSRCIFFAPDLWGTVTREIICLLLQITLRAGITSFAFSDHFSTSKHNGSITTICQKNVFSSFLCWEDRWLWSRELPHPRWFCAVMDLLILGDLWILSLSPLPSRARGLFTPLSPSQLELPDKRPGVKPPLSWMWHFSLRSLWLQERKRQIPFERLNNLLLAYIYIF